MSSFHAPPPPPVPSDPLLEAGDALMRAGRPREACEAYQVAWSQARKIDDTTRRVWVLLAAANAHLRAGDPEGAWWLCASLVEWHADSGIVVGNPLFHLVAGLAAHELGEVPTSTDNLARALICGGPDLFVDEDPQHLRQMKRTLLPPPELGKWKGYTGCTRDTLNGATGYLAELLTGRLRTPPPYHHED